MQAAEDPVPLPPIPNIPPVIIEREGIRQSQKRPNLEADCVICLKPPTPNQLAYCSGFCALIICT